MKQPDSINLKVSSSPLELETFGDRLYRILGREPARTFALRAKLTPAAFHKYLKGQSEPTRPVMNAIAETAGVNLEWLSTGRGPMRKSDALPVTTAGNILTAATPHPFVITNLDGRQVEYKPAPGLSHVPVLTIEAACGLGTMIEGEEISAVFSATEAWFRRELGTSSKNLTIIKARGDSMMSTIMPEEMVFVDRSASDEPGDGLWVYRFEDAVFLKRLQLLPGRIIKVMSDNPVYTPYELKPDDSFRLMGRVIAALPLRRL